MTPDASDILPELVRGKSVVGVIVLRDMEAEELAYGCLGYGTAETNDGSGTVIDPTLFVIDSRLDRGGLILLCMLEFGLDIEETGGLAAIDRASGW